MANTSPVFYDVAFSVASLIFFTMQHQPSDNSTWEEVILEMIRETSENYTGQLASILPGLVESIPRISHAFNQIATKYAIMNITSNDVNSVPDTQSTNSLWSTVVWPRAEKNDFSSYTTDDLAKLEILRKEFAPPSIVCYQVQGKYVLTSLTHLDILLIWSLVAVAPIYHIYSQALQVLSPSRRIIYEGSTTHELDNLNLLAQVYHTHLCDVSLRKVRGGSIQVTTTKEHEKSAIVKLVSRNLRQESSAVVIESSPHDQASLYDVMISLIHQIISQRPTLFSHIQNLMVEMLQQSIWTKEAVEHALHSIFIHSEGVDFIIVIHNFDSPLWPDEIRIWWSNIPTFLGTSNCSTCTFLISCNQPKGNLTAGRLHHVDLETLSPSPREAFINAKINQLFENAFTSASRKGLFYESAKERLIARATKFEGSFNDINAFIIHIFHGLSLTAPNAILRDMSLIPPTPEELYKSHLQLLKWKDPMVFCWAKNFLAWVKLSVRPLRMEELAVATAIVPGQIHIVEIRDSIAIDIERDIRKYLRSLVSIKNGCVCVGSLSVEHVLSETSSLDLADDSNLALKCLSYLTLVLKAPEEGNLWEKCLSYVSYKHRMEGIPEPTLEFLDYAIRYWPTHFLRAKSPNSILATTVVQFLQSITISSRWFQLYLLCNGFRPILPHGGRNLPIRLTANSKEVYDNASLNADPHDDSLNGGTIATADFKIDTSMELSPNAIAMNLNTRPSAIEMASLSGLSSIIPILLGEENMDTPNQIHVRRGFFQSRVAISNTDSRDYLESIISNDDSKTVASLLDIDKRKLSELFPLHMAVLAGSPKTTQVLLSKLERTTEVDKHGRTVFHMAAIGGRVDIFEILLEGSKGTQLPKWLVDEIHKEDNNAETPLTLATRMGNFDAACLLAPIGNGRGLSIPDGTGKTPAHHAVINCPQALPIFFAQNPGILLAQDQNGATPLHIAAGYGRINAVLTITGFEIDPEARKKMIEMEDNQEMAPLHCAVQNGFDSVVDILIQDEAINMKTLSEIAAELATKHGNLHILRKLKRWTGDIKTHLLSEAAKAGQILVTKYLLQTGAKPNGDEDSSDKPLGIAASKGHQEVVRALLGAGADINLADSDRQTPLHLSAKENQENITKILLGWQQISSETNASTQWASIDAPDSSRNTPLHLSAYNGNVNIMNMLLGSGANVMAHSITLDTPLHLAVAHPEAVEILLNFGAEVDAENARRKTPLHEATIQKIVATVRLLLEAGANLTSVDDEGKRPAYYAIETKDIPTIQEIFRDDYPEDYLWDDLEAAVKASTPSILELLVNKFPDAAKRPNDTGRLLLHVAAENNAFSMVGILVQLGLDVNTPDNDQNTPLYVASSLGHSKTMKELIALGAEIDKVAEGGATPLQAAAGRRNREACDVLLKAGASVNSFGSSDKTPLFIACYQGNIGVVRALLANDADPSLCSRDDWSNGWSPLHAAADSVDISKLLVESHAAINYQKHDGWAPIHLAAGWGHQDVVQFLLGEGADPNILNEDGNAPLHIAIKRGRHDVLKTMIDHKGNNTIDFNIINKEGLAPIHMAIQLGVEAVKILLDKRVDFKVRTAHGLSCLDLAVSLYSNEVLKCLLLASNSGDYVPDWDRQNIVAAYWRAVELTNIESGVLHTLLELDHSLVVEVSEEGFNGLETYMRGRKADEGGRHNPLVFLDFEFNPFQHPPGEKSAFELGATVEHGVNREFLEKCVGILHRYPQVSSLGFRELRIITELDGQIPIEAIDSMGDSIKSEIDGDGWNIDHFIYQSSPRLGFSRRENGMIDKETSKPTSWRKEISEDNIQTELGKLQHLSFHQPGFLR